jgi:hypothetical protein
VAESRSVEPIGMPSEEVLGDTDVQRVAPLPWLLSGYAAAFDRLRSAIGDLNEQRIYHALFEALNWATSIDERMDHLGRPLDDELLRGLRFPRNRSQHQWADAIERRDVRRPAMEIHLAGTGGGGSRSPELVADWYWRSVASFPDGLSNAGKDQYAERLEGRPVRQALDHLAQLFANMESEASELEML